MMQKLKLKPLQINTLDVTIRASRPNGRVITARFFWLIVFGVVLLTWCEPGFWRH